MGPPSSRNVFHVQCIGSGKRLASMTPELQCRMKGRMSVSKRIVWGAATVSVLLVHLALPARAQQPAGRSNALQQLNGSVASMVGTVSRSVVQVVVTSYGPVDQPSRTETDLVIGRQRSMGSGVVIDAGGYVMTNAHVVSNARRVQVVLPGSASGEGGARASVKRRTRTVDATIVGVAREID